MGRAPHGQAKIARPAGKKLQPSDPEIRILPKLNGPCPALLSIARFVPQTDNSLGPTGAGQEHTSKMSEVCLNQA